jgi:hypothetical protein
VINDSLRGAGDGALVAVGSCVNGSAAVSNRKDRPLESDGAGLDPYVGVDGGGEPDGCVEEGGGGNKCRGLKRYIGDVDHHVAVDSCRDVDGCEQQDLTGCGLGGSGSYTDSY